MRTVFAVEFVPGPSREVCLAARGTQVTRHYGLGGSTKAVVVENSLDGVGLQDGRERFKRADLNHDGVIDQEEFRAYDKTLPRMSLGTSSQ